MKRQIVVPCILLLVVMATVCRAQEQPVIGLRQGLSLWLNKSGAGPGSLRFPDGKRFVSDKELFARVPVWKHWIAETGVQHYQLLGTSLDENKAVSVRTRQYLQLNLSLQRDISYPILGYLVPYFFKMRSYAGVSVSPRISFASKEKGIRIDPMPLVGVNYTHLLPISQRLSAISCFAYRTILFDRFEQQHRAFNMPNRAFSWWGGLLYQLDKPDSKNR